MSKKLIDLYKDWMRTKALPDNGLCHSIPEKYKKYLEILSPTNDELDLMEKKSLSVVYWGSGLHGYNPNRVVTFTPLRQTIVLLICAMHNEI